MECLLRMVIALTAFLPILVLILILMECLLSIPNIQGVCIKDTCLNPYSNGMLLSKYEKF